MRSRWLAAGLSGLLVLTGCGHGSKSVAASSVTKKGSILAVAKRRPAGAMTGQLLTKQQYQLSQDAGHVVVLNYFASWCPPCQTETPQFDNVYRERKAAGVRFVGLGVKDPRAKIASWIKAKDITFPVITDEVGKTAIALGDIPLTGLPDTVLVDKHGRIAAVYIGPLTAADLKPALDQLQAES